ncbi:MAG TPA: hypothetical protein VN643_00375 [Pyrinomonadaceae bacterium]|nr:hypothetical protein [Pyrinomonadaceae bacterium]
MSTRTESINALFAKGTIEILLTEAIKTGAGTYSPVSIGRYCRGTKLLCEFHFDSE